MSDYHLGQGWHRHGDVYWRTHPQDGSPIRTPALDEICRWVDSRLESQPIDDIETPVERIVDLLQWHQVVDVLEELWALDRLPDGYINPEVVKNPALLFPERSAPKHVEFSAVFPQKRSPGALLKALIAHVVQTRLDNIEPDVLWPPIPDFEDESLENLDDDT